MDIGAKTIWLTLPPRASWMVEPTELRPGILLARTLLSDDPIGARPRILICRPTTCIVTEGDLLGAAESVKINPPVSTDGTQPVVDCPAPVGLKHLPTSIEGGQPSTEPPIFDEPQHLPAASTDYWRVQCLIDALPAELSTDQRSTAELFIKSHEQTFSRTPTDLGRNRMVPHGINMGTELPIRQPVRRQPYFHLPEIEKNVTELLAAKVIEPAQCGDG